MDSDLPPHPLAAKHAAIPTCWYLGGEFSRITVPYTLCHQRRNLQRCNTATQHKMMCLYVCEKNGHPSTILNSILKSFIFHWNWGPSGPSGTSGPSGPRRPSPSTSSPAKISAPAPSASGWNMLKLHHRWSPRHNSWEQTALLIATLPPGCQCSSSICKSHMPNDYANRNTCVLVQNGHVNCQLLELLLHITWSMFIALCFHFSIFFPFNALPHRTPPMKASSSRSPPQSTDWCFEMIFPPLPQRIFVNWPQDQAELNRSKVFKHKYYK